MLMMMKTSSYITEQGMYKIAERCNWDLRDIKLHLLRETDIEKGTQLSRVMRKFKDLINNQTETVRISPRILEIKKKLEG